MMKGVWAVWACLPECPADCSPFNSYDHWHCCAAAGSTISRWGLLLGTLLQMCCHENAAKLLLRAFLPSLHVGGKTRLCQDYFEFSGSAKPARHMSRLILPWFITPESFLMQVQTHKYSNVIVAYHGIPVSTGRTMGQLLMVWPDLTDNLNSVTLFHEKSYGPGNVGWHCFPKP